MIVEENDPVAIKKLINIINNDPNSVSKLTVDFALKTNINEYIVDDIMSDKWPAAVDNFLIANNTDEDMRLRAESIASILLPPLKNKRFLDFGCGEGYLAEFAAKETVISVGHDISNKGWDKIIKSDNLILTDDFDNVVKNAPYDYIMAYDVFDHLEGKENQKTVFAKLKNVLAKDGMLYVRFHPWCSRTGTHLYKSLNKAYIHMFLSDEQLIEMGHIPLPTIKLIHPMAVYDDWIKSAGFRLMKREVTRETVEDFFKKNYISDKIKAHWGTSHDINLSSGKVFPLFQLEQQFVDLVLI